MRIDPFYQKEVYMKKKKITVFGVFLLAVLFSACGTDQKQLAEESEVNTEEAERESDELSVQADEDVLIWRIDSPLDAEESEITKEMISVWQEPLNRLLKEKGADYSVLIEPILRTDGGEDPVTTADELEQLKKSGSRTDIITLLSATQQEDLNGYELTYPECVKRDLLQPFGNLLMMHEDDASQNGVFSGEQWKRLSESLCEQDLARADLNGTAYGISAVLPAMKAVVYAKESMSRYGIRQEDLSGRIFENEAIFQRVKEASKEAPYGILSGDVRQKLGFWIVSPTNSVALGTDGTFVNITETKEFREYLQTLMDWKQKGLVEVIGDKQTTYFAQDYSSGINYCDQPYETDVTIFMGSTEEVISAFVVPNQAEPVIDPYWGDSKVCIASWSKKKEEAADFIVRLFTDPEIADLIQYGREGEEYESDGAVLHVRPESNIILRIFGGQYTNPLISHSTAFMPKEKTAYAERFHETYDAELPDGFRLDPAPVLQEIAETNQIFGYESGSDTARKIVRLEFDDVDRVIADITRELKAAGMDRIVEEANRQLAEWKKGT